MLQSCAYHRCIKSHIGDKTVYVQSGNLVIPVQIPSTICDKYEEEATPWGIL